MTGVGTTIFPGINQHILEGFDDCGEH